MYVSLNLTLSCLLDELSEKFAVSQAKLAQALANDTTGMGTSRPYLIVIKRIWSYFIIYSISSISSISGMASVALWHPLHSWPLWPPPPTSPFHVCWMTPGGLVELARVQGALEREQQRSREQEQLNQQLEQQIQHLKQEVGETAPYKGGRGYSTLQGR